MTPVSRLATTVHDCNNEYVIEFFGEQNGVRKDMNKTASHVLPKEASATGIFTDPLKRCLNADDETMLKAWLTLGVVACRVFKLSESLGTKLQFHRAKARFT